MLSRSYPFDRYKRMSEPKLNGTIQSYNFSRRNSESNNPFSSKFPDLLVLFYDYQNLHMYSGDVHSLWCWHLNTTWRVWSVINDSIWGTKTNYCVICDRAVNLLHNLKINCIIYFYFFLFLLSSNSWKTMAEWTGLISY